jgi:hypothetical protein
MCDLSEIQASTHYVTVQKSSFEKNIWQYFTAKVAWEAEEGIVEPAPWLDSFFIC